MTAADPWPFNVPPRRRRPCEVSADQAFLWGLLGGAIAKDPVSGALVGGLVGQAVSQPQPVSLDRALREAFAAFGLPVIAIYRYGPYHVRVLFTYQNQFWTVDTHAPAHFAWTQRDLDDWLFGDILDFQLPMRLREIGRPT